MMRGSSKLDVDSQAHAKQKKGCRSKNASADDDSGQFMIMLALVLWRSTRANIHQTQDTIIQPERFLAPF